VCLGEGTLVCLGEGTLARVQACASVCACESAHARVCIYIREHTPHAACYPACRWLLYARTHTRGTEALGRAARVQRNWATRNLKGGHIKERLGALLARIRAIRREVLQQLCVRVDGPLVVVRAAGSLYSPSTPILLSSPAAPGSAS